jgi:hypothetical protein
MPAGGRYVKGPSREDQQAEAKDGGNSIGRAVGKPEKAAPTLQIKRGESDPP